MKMSIIIPVFDRVELLKKGLESIEQQNIVEEFEIIVINDYLPDETEAVCKSFSNLDIKYYFSGKRNLNGIIWRCPSFAINIGVQKAKGEYILLTGAEIYYLTPNAINNMLTECSNSLHTLAIPIKGYDDMVGEETLKLLTGDSVNIEKLDNLNVKLPFCLLLKTSEFISIGGYDEDFTGYCFDDGDIVERLLSNGCKYKLISEAKIIHLFHGARGAGRKHLTNRVKRWKDNKKLYESKKDIIQRNVNKPWGVL